MVSPQLDSCSCVYDYGGCTTPSSIIPVPHGHDSEVTSFRSLLYGMV